VRPDCGGIRVPRSRHELGLSTVPNGFSPSAVRRSLAQAASSSCELSVSFRVLRPAACPPYPEKPCGLPEAEERLPSGPLPHRGTSWRRPHEHGIPTPHPVPSSTFLTSPRVCSATDLCGLVSSRSHVQGLPFRGLSLSAEPYRVSPADSCPLAVERNSLRFDPRQPPRPRLQGLAPRDECGAVRDCLGPDRSAPLLGFSSSGCSSHASSERFHVPSGLTFTAMSPPQLVPAVLPMHGPVCVVTTPPTRSRFLA